jgi:hypothetical protein
VRLKVLPALNQQEIPTLVKDLLLELTGCPSSVSWPEDAPRTDSVNVDQLQRVPQWAPPAPQAVLGYRHQLLAAATVWK